MLPAKLKKELQRDVRASEHPREKAVDVMYAVQRHYGYLSDEGLAEAASLLGMSELELEELATFYDYIYRRPVGRFVLHVCDGVVCWMCHEGWACLAEEESIVTYLCARLGVEVGQTTPDGMFTVLPSACIGYCEYAPAMLVNGKPYGPLTPQSLDKVLDELRNQPPGHLVLDR
ncbi:MAG: NADH-quinone oxidoreductase subunit NuoE [Desulfarculaceae bacterium]|nr:NADH-quinone oxidoreductase subunit NuoE [Desulfarculaceae bacterium]